VSILVSAYGLTKSFSANPLFDGLTFTVETGNRIGLIGPNGMGKSTLLRILSRQASADDGDLSFASGLRTAFLEQVPTLDEELTIYQTVVENVDPEDWETQGLAHETISRIGLQQFSDTTKIATLSGGWRKRVALARELTKKPDLLLLDEPTNHLDIEGIMWLEKYLRGARFATLTVTHDRLFLQRVSNQIIELDRRHPGGLLKVKGDYSKYLEVREALISSQERREVILKNTLRRETEWLRQGAKARTTKQQARIDQAGVLKDTVEDLSRRNLKRTATFEFQSVGRSPKKLIEAIKISKKYDENLIFSNFSLKVTPRSRIGLLGNNGAGKSTLIRVLLGLEPPTSGTLFQSDQLEVAYFDQTRQALDPELTVSETLCPSGTHVDYCGKPIHIRGYLDRFLFDHQQSEMKVKKLSGGELSRLLIAHLMLERANVLVLDEPTNDLDLATLTVLEECLKEFNGAVILVTHDRYFLDQVVDQLIAFPEPGSGDSELIAFANFSQWETWRETRGTRSRSLPETAKKAEPPYTAKSQKKRLGFKERREFESMEATIQEAEANLQALTRESTAPKNISNSKALAEITAKMSAAQTEIERLYKRWAELEERK